MEDNNNYFGKLTNLSEVVQEDGSVIVTFEADERFCKRVGEALKLGRAPTPEEVTNFVETAIARKRFLAEKTDKDSKVLQDSANKQDLS